MLRQFSTSFTTMISRCRPSAPVVAVIGATGTGKSRLAVNLATKFNGEIINCDAIQMYEGLPIITNKITVEEQNGIPHHLLGCIGLDESTWTVADFIPHALEKISDIQSRGRLPILVGGTHYYIQSLLVNESTLQSDHSKKDTDERLALLEEPTSKLLEKLREVDPVMADRWHPNERRKIQRSLEIWLQTGKPASEVYLQQTEKLDSDGLLTGTEESTHNSQLRLDTLIFWLDTPKDVLRERLDSRVGKMLEAGLMKEVRSLSTLQTHKELEGHSPDLTRGIWVAIGYKEFFPYNSACQNGEPEKQTEALRKEGIERTQSATRQYAKRQLSWIRHKFMTAMERSNASDRLFVLHNTDVDQFETEVELTAQEVMEKFLNGEELPDPKSLSEAAGELLMKMGQDVSQSRSEWMRQTCEACNTTTVTKTEWEKHVNSNRHRKIVAAKRRRLELGQLGAQRSLETVE